MAKGVYFGVDGKAKKVKTIYTSINGIAKKIIKAYVGDKNDIAKQFWPLAQEKWVRCNMLTFNNDIVVLGYYQTLGEFQNDLVEMDKTGTYTSFLQEGVDKGHIKLEGDPDYNPEVDRWEDAELTATSDLYKNVKVNDTKTNIVGVDSVEDFDDSWSYRGAGSDWNYAFDKSISHINTPGAYVGHIYDVDIALVDATYYAFNDVVEAAEGMYPDQGVAGDHYYIKVGDKYIWYVYDAVLSEEIPGTKESYGNKYDTIEIEGEESPTFNVVTKNNLEFTSDKTIFSRLKVSENNGGIQLEGRDAVSCYNSFSQELVQYNFVEDEDSPTGWGVIVAAIQKSGSKEWTVTYHHIKEFKELFTIFKDEGLDTILVEVDDSDPNKYPQDGYENGKYYKLIYTKN